MITDEDLIEAFRMDAIGRTYLAHFLRDGGVTTSRYLVADTLTEAKRLAREYGVRFLNDAHLVSVGIVR